MFPFGLELAPSGKKVAGRSLGQFPNATLHVMKIEIIVSHRPDMSMLGYAVRMGRRNRFAGRLKASNNRSEHDR